MRPHSVLPCVQVLSGSSLFLYDPCGEYLFTGADPHTPERDSQKASPTANRQQPQQQQRQQRGVTRARRPSSSSSSASSPTTASRTPSPTSSVFLYASQSPRPRSAFSSASSSSALRGGSAHRPVTGVGGARRSPGGGGGGGGGQYQAGATRRDPIGKRYAVRREDVLNQFPHQVRPSLSLSRLPSLFLGFSSTLTLLLRLTVTSSLLSPRNKSHGISKKFVPKKLDAQYVP